MSKEYKGICENCIYDRIQYVHEQACPVSKFLIDNDIHITAPIYSISDCGFYTERTTILPLGLE